MCTLEVNLSLQPKDHSESYDLQKVLVIDGIPVRTSHVDLSEYEHLKDLPYPTAASVDVLIGQNYSELLLVHEYRRGLHGQPYAAKTALGWCFNGPTKHNPSSKNVTSHLISVNQIEEKLDRLYELELEGPIDKCAWSAEDSDVVDLWQRSCKVEDSHASLPIPWKNDDCLMPNNFYLAKHRLDSLMKSLTRKGILSKYDNEVKHLVKNRYAEHAPVTPQGSRCWYLPHHSVPKKTGQLRLVFDCSAQYKGMSLNSNCLQGPKFTCDLFDVLIRFRQFQYAFMADIRHMYNQVRIPISDRDALRFIWYEGGNLVHYRMTCFIFGGVFCASGSSYALQQTSQLTDDRRIQDVIKNNFYVDDLAYSTNDMHDAKMIVNGVRRVLAMRSFHLTKFIATDAQIVSDIEPQDRLPESNKHIQSHVDKALGIGWCIDSDELYIMNKLKHARTRSELLSSLATIFDPLGILAPLTIYGKLIFQETTRQKLPWQSSLPVEIQEEWNSWTDMVQEIGQISVKRCMIPPEFSDGVFELHIFSDASSQAYGSVVYLRCLNKYGNIHVALVCSKNRVCPVKSTITIPRLELQAAVLSTILEQSATKALSICLLSTTYWTDSMIVIGFLNNTHRRFQTYVANRIGKIKLHSNPEQWLFVPGELNPADLLTRKKLPSQFNRSSWYTGPEFLRSHKSTWNTNRNVITELPERHPEIKRDRPIIMATDVIKHPLDVLINYYSNWDKLKRAVGWLRRLIAIMRNQTQPCDYLQPEELTRAEQILLTYVQKSAFSKDITHIIAGSALPKHSALYRLDPYIDENGLLVVGGRLRHSNLSHREKHPYILPYKNRLSTLIARSFHNRCHLGREWVVSLIRKCYWIIKVRSIVYKVCQDCVICKMLFAPSAHQKMADLPDCRLTYDKLPFDHISIDCFGPFSVKYRRSTCKRYGCVFTCHNIRAVHIEKLDDLTCDSFINGLRRLISRRGKPSLIMCDRGTNFIAAKSELTRSMGQLDIKWEFLPAGASHMNGVVERQIRTIRKVLTGMLTDQQRLTDDLLCTLFCEVEGIVNSRPLTKVSDDPADDAAITPSDLLNVRSSPPVSLGNFSQGDMFRRKWRYLQHLVDLFWKRYLREYIPQLQKRALWTKERKSIESGDLVIVMDENTPRRQWPKALVVEAREGRDGLVRSVMVRCKGHLVTRPVTKIVPLECD